MDVQVNKVSKTTKQNNLKNRQIYNASENSFGVVCDQWKTDVVLIDVII